MDFLNVLVILTGLGNLFLGYLVFVRGAKNIITYSLGCYAFVSGIWSFSLIFYQMQFILSALVWIKIVYAIVFLLVFGLFYFSLEFSHKTKETIAFLSFLYFALAAPLLYFLFFTDSWIKGIVEKSWGPETLLGPTYIWVSIFWAVFGMWNVFNLMQEYFRCKGIDRERVRYILAGFAFFVVIVVTADEIIPIFFGDTRYFRVSPLSSLFFVGFTAYAILRYRLMDIRMVIGRGTVYLLSMASAIGLAFLMFYSNNLLSNPIAFTIAGPLIVAISIALYQPIYYFLEKIASRYFYYNFYSYQNVLTKLSKGLTQVLDLDDLTSLIVNTLMETMKLDRAVILMRQSDQGEFRIQKNVGFRETNGISLVRDNFLTSWLERTQKPLVYEEISLLMRDTGKLEEKAKLEKLQENMKKIEAALCLPLMVKGKIAGMIVLGNKVNGGIYSEQDAALLVNLSNQAAIAIQNATLYVEVKNFNKKLTNEVARATDELRTAYEELKKLDKAKSEFIAIASHQLRTPLAVIKGYISLIIEKTYGESLENMVRPLENIYSSNERMIKLVNDLLNVTTIEAGKIEMKYTKCRVTEIIDAVIKELDNIAKERGLYLKFEKPKKAMAQIVCDFDKVGHVVMNLVDNATRYTKTGGVTVSCQMKGNDCEITIADTGAGMDSEEIKNLFESFSRGAAGFQLWTEGTGLGLYVAKRFVQMHGGKIWVESDGKGKGSTFHILLPANADKKQLEGFELAVSAEIGK